MNLKSLTIVSVLSLVAQYSLAWEAEIGTTLGLGDEAWVSYLMNDGSTEEFFPGDSGLQLLIAKDIYQSGKTTAYIQTGYHNSSMSTPITTSVDVVDSFSFIPVNAFATYQVTPNMKLGAGINYLLAPRFKQAISMYEADFEFTSKIGYILKFQHAFPNTDSWVVGVDYFSNRIQFSNFSDSEGDSTVASGDEEPYSISALSISIGYVF